MEGWHDSQRGGWPGKISGPCLDLPKARAYKSFRIGDLYYKVEFQKRNFDKRRDTSTIKSNEFSVPLVNAKHGNNGIMYYGRPEIFDSEEMTIDIVQNGAIATGDVYPQPQRTGVLWDAYLIKARYHTDTKRTLCYIATAIYKAIKPKYSYDDKAYWDFVSNDKIILPVDNTGKIDLDFMEKSICALEQARIRTLKAYLLAAGFANTTLTEVERIAIADYRHGLFDKNLIKAEKLFAIKGNPQLNKEFFTFSPNAEYPYFTRTVMNNGILGYVDYLDDKHKIKGNSLAVGMIGMQFFYMAHDFYAGQFTKTAFAKFSGFNETVALYFIAQFLPHQKYLQSGLVRDFERLFNSVDVGVPLDSDGDIDCDRIDAFIRGLIKKAIGRVMAQKDLEITTMQKVADASNEMTSCHYDAPEEEESPRLAADENGE